MIPGISRVVFILICISSFFLMSGCNGDDDQNALRREPVLDIRALADFAEADAEFNQVLLRMQMLHTNADILKRGLQTPEEHQHRLSYYLFGFKNDITLISGTDTIPCYDLHMERTYMDLPYMNFILTFNHAIKEGDEVLVNDIVYTQQMLITTLEPNLDPQ